MRQSSVFRRGRFLGWGVAGSEAYDRGDPSAWAAVTLVDDDASPAGRTALVVRWLSAGMSSNSILLDDDSPTEWSTLQQ